MSRDPRIVIALVCHAMVMLSALAMITESAAPVPVRIALAALSCAVLLPGLWTLLAARSARYPWLALLLVIVIGAGLVEVFASGGALGATVFLGAAMLEFAVLVSMSRQRTQREPRVPEQP